MKTKFETNVASKTPKEKQEEPGLPWQVGAEDIEKAAGPEGAGSLAALGVSPFKTRAEVLVIVLGVIFIVTISFVSFMKKETLRTKNEVAMKEEAVSALESRVNKLNDENSAMNSSLTDLEKRLSELTVQKELFTDVLDGLVQNPDEPVPQTKIE